MRHEFRLADIGEGLEEAEVITWLVQVGDRVERDQPVVEVMTDKSNAELPAPAAGVVVERPAAVGDMLVVGELIAVIDDELTTSPTAPQPAPPKPPTAAQPAPPTASAVAAAAQGPRIKASPSTRRVAAERGIDLTTIVGSGPGGRILLDDLEPPSPTTGAPPSPPVSPTSTAPQPPLATATGSEPPSGNVVPLRGIRRPVAQNMARSWFDIPHIHAFEHIDAQPLLDFQSQLRSSSNSAFERVTPLTLFAAAVASALRAHPQANSSINMAEETITHHPAVNLGIAVAAPQGLVVPVLAAADEMTLEQLARSIQELVDAARAGSLTPGQFKGGTSTLTNFGSLGGEQATPLIRPPESAIFGFGAVADRPFVIDAQVVARPTMHLVMGADHRLLDGDVTTAVLQHITTILTNPIELLV